jgi:ankyrin repeat protein
MGRSSLCIACAKHDDPKCVEELLRLNAAINTVDNHAVTPLMAASEAGHAQVVAVLLRRVYHKRKREDAVVALREATVDEGDNLAAILSSTMFGAPENDPFSPHYKGERGLRRRSFVEEPEPILTPF